MTDPSEHSDDDELREAEAVAWIVRRDRGLSVAEQAEFAAWLKADPRHASALAQQQRDWQRLDQLVKLRPKHNVRPDRHLLRPRAEPSRRQAWQWLAGLAAAAGLVLAAPWWSPADSAPPAERHAELAAPERLQLEDGSVVELGRGAALSVAFRSGERRVVLERGAAIFFVAKDPARPFVVAAGGVEARAVGTAFTVGLENGSVAVLVTEGRVALAEPAAPAIAAPLPLLEPRQRVVLSPGSGEAPPRVETLSAAEIRRELAWQHRLLDFTDAPLADVVLEFNRRNAVHLEIGDPEVAALRLSASIRSDNLDAFVHLLEEGLGVQVDRSDDRRIVLRRRS